MISAARWAREKKVPYLGICLGFQIAVIEYVRNVLGIETAGSAELDANCKDPVIIYMPEISKTHLGGTMRLGLRPSIFQKGTEEWSKIRQLYGGEPVVWERHRHRYEVNPEYVERIESAASNPSVKAASQKAPSSIPQSPPLRHPSPSHLPDSDTPLPPHRMPLPASTSSNLSEETKRESECRSPSCATTILCRYAGASRILLASTQPIASLPRFHRRIGRLVGGTVGCTEELRTTSSQEPHDQRGRDDST